MERAPRISSWKSVTPTRAYCASIRDIGSAMKSGDIKPTDVESPTWTTDVQDVRGGPGTVVVVGPTDVLVTAEPGGAAAGDDREPSIHAPTTVSTTTSAAGM